jgi:hypothetical protein
MRIPVAAAVVILDDVFESGEATVVHVGRSAGDLAQGRCFEIASPGSGVGEFAAAPGDTSVVQPLIREIRPGVARDAVGPSSEQTASRPALPP